jgi:toxin ParE1/3/4
MRILVVRPQVEAEIIDAYRYYENSRAGLGKAFVNAVVIAVDGIVRTPLAHPLLYGKKRRVFVRGFPYSIYYEVLTARIRITSIIHHRRHPRRWQRPGMSTAAVGQSRDKKR